jgi:hypothetical protein
MFDAPQGLYTSAELLHGISAKDPLGFTLTYDFSVFQVLMLTAASPLR